MCQWAQARANRNNRNALIVGGKLATLQVAPRPFLSSVSFSRSAGRVRSNVAVGASRPAATSQFSSVGSALHDASPGQKAGYNRPMNGRSGDANNRISCRNGCNYPGPPSSVHFVPPLCTRPVVSIGAARPGHHYTLMQEGMIHLTTWGGPCRCVHVDILAIHAFNICFRSPTPFVFFLIAIFACICSTFFSALTTERSQSPGVGGRVNCTTSNGP